MGVSLITIKRLTSDCLMQKVLKRVKDEDCTITVSTEMLSIELNSSFKYKKYMKNMCILSL